MAKVITVIPVYTDDAMRKLEKAEELLREVAAASIDFESFPYFKSSSIAIGDVPFMDMRNENG